MTQQLSQTLRNHTYSTKMNLIKGLPGKIIGNYIYFHGFCCFWEINHEISSLQAYDLQILFSINFTQHSDNVNLLLQN